MTGTQRVVRSVAVLAGVTVVLAVVLEMNRLADQMKQQKAGFSVSRNDDVSGGDRQALGDYARRLVPLVGPVPLGVALTVTGDPGFRARVETGREDGADWSSYAVRIRNLGTQSFDGSLSTGCAWLVTADGGRIDAPVVRVDSAGVVSATAIGAGAEVDLVLAFRVPAQVRPVRLGLCLQLGRYVPQAVWLLVP